MNSEAWMAGEVGFQLTEADWIATSRDLLRERYGTSDPVRQVQLVSTIILLFLLLAWMINAAMASLSLNQNGLFALLPFAVSAAACCWFWLDYVYRRVPQHARRLLRQRAVFQRPLRYSWSEEGLGFQTAHVSGLIPWLDLYRWRAAQHSFLFYTDEQTVYFIPRSALSDAQVEDLEAIVAASGAPGPPRLEDRLIYP
jgi:hypothetical protein